MRCPVLRYDVAPLGFTLEGTTQEVENATIEIKGVTLSYIRTDTAFKLKLPETDIRLQYITTSNTLF